MRRPLNCCGVLILSLLLLAAAPAKAQDLSIFGLDFGGGEHATASEGTHEAGKGDGDEALDDSLDRIIRTLQDDSERQALVDQLKTLRNASTQTAAAQAQPSLLSSLGHQLAGGEAHVVPAPAAVWSARASRGQADLAALREKLEPRGALMGLLQAAIVVGAWIALVLGGATAARTLWRTRDWPLNLPDEPRPWVLAAYGLRQLTPWLLAFLVLRLTLPWIELARPASVAALMVGFAGLAGKTFALVFETVISMFTRGYRRPAVAILRQRAGRPLFVIGALVAAGYAFAQPALAPLLGDSLHRWLGMLSNVAAALLSAVFVLRFRRPIAHLIANRSYAQRSRPGVTRELMVLLSRIWHLSALLMIGASLTAIATGGGESGAAFAKALVCTGLLVLALLASGMLRRQAERTLRGRRHSQYRARITRFVFTLGQCLAGLLFIEAALRVWGLSLLALDGESDGAIGPQLGQALIGIGLTVLGAWLVWIVVDTAIQRALNGSNQSRRARRRNNNRAQTITPMIRNMAAATILIIATIAGLANLGVNVTPLLAGAGVVGLAIGFGAQTLVQDLITGVFILIEDSLAVGDFVEINGYMGSVEGLNLRAVRLRDLDGVLHITTFSHIDSIHNMSRQFGIALMKLRIPHDLPIDDAIALMHRTAADLRQEPGMRGLVWSGLEIQGIQAFEDGCPILRIRLRTAPEYQWDVARAFNLQLKKRMEAEYVDLATPRLSLTMNDANDGRSDWRNASRERTQNTSADGPADNGTHSASSSQSA